MIPIGDVIETLGISRYSLVYAWRSGEIPEPTTIRCRRYFSLADWKKIEKYLESHSPEARRVLSVPGFPLD